MAKLKKMFFKGRMNKSADERFVPKGEHVDAKNIRINSSADDDMYVVETVRGNVLVADPDPNGIGLSSSAVGIGTFGDEQFDRVFVFVHDPASDSASGVLDSIYAYTPSTGSIDYHVTSIDDGTGVTNLGFTETTIITECILLENELYILIEGQQPMVIDLDVTYSNDGSVDTFSKEDILVIKKPPLESPEVNLIETSNEDDYLEDRFACYAYRYRYANNKYSSTSPFSLPAYLPSPFDLSYETFNNEGMRNAFNAAVVTFNTGGEDVVGVDVLVKDSRDNVIKVVQRINKLLDGVPDNSTESYTFSSNKIFTTLPQSEILRLCDRVPMEAGTMTLMGNRLMYSDYEEGDDMIDLNGNPVSSNFITFFTSTDPGNKVIEGTVESAEYTVGESFASASSGIDIDFSGLDLKAGSFISIELGTNHLDYNEDLPFPEATPGFLNNIIEVLLTKDYNTVYELSISDDFKKAVGTSGFNSPVSSACNSITGSFTDKLTCAMPSNLDSLVKTNFGVDSLGDGTKIISSPTSDNIKLILPAYLYTDDPLSPTQSVYSYLQITSSFIRFNQSINNRSLHSGWEYEIHKVYLDEFGRHSNPISSPNSTVKIPYSASNTVNQISVGIPSGERPPDWAHAYKFVIRSNKELYQTVYSSYIYTEPGTNDTFFLLEGENSSKIEIGDTLIVKADVSGAVNSKIKVSVLDKKVYGPNDLTAGSPAGAYMKLTANKFNTAIPDGAVFAPGIKKKRVGAGIELTDSSYPTIGYELFEENPDGPLAFKPIEITAGTRISIEFNIGRRGYLGGCGRESYIYKKNFIASADYDNFKLWWDAEGVDFNENTTSVDGEEVNTWVYDPVLAPPGTSLPIVPEINKNKVRFSQSTDGKFFITISSGTPACTGLFEGEKREAFAELEIEIIKGNGFVVFETEPSEALQDVYYEGSQTFFIEEGAHLGSDGDDQVIGSSFAICNLNFFNCFSFGNGVESYRVDDSLKGRDFSLGERVYGTQDGEYRRVKRSTDITYSGIFNDESNINKLNEFNAGLLNFKRLEERFGKVNKIDGRATDILVLQEDRISYVTAGKNLLTDAVGGGSITSVPEVLGTQIARIEEVGLSNRESFAKYGPLKTFMDTKRGIVVQLSGSDKSESLSILTNGMTSYFRDLSIENENKVFLGAFDKFNKEYVLHTNETDKPQLNRILNCGSDTLVSLDDGESTEFEVDFGFIVGSVIVEYFLGIIAGSISIDVAYDGTTISRGSLTTSGSFSFDKTNPGVQTAKFTVTAIDGPANVEIRPNCVSRTTLNVKTVVLTSGSDSGESIHVGYSWTILGYQSPEISDLVSFPSTSTPLNRTLDKDRLGSQGLPFIPAQQSDIKMVIKKKNVDTFDFNPSKHNLYWARTSAVLTDEQLITNTQAATPLTNDGGGDYSYLISTFPASGDTLYLIYDLRENVSETLNYSTISAVDACCN